MANITASLVNELRQRTGVGMMDCKKALVECDGDMDKAIDYLREKGQKLAAKRADRDASEGAVLAGVNADKTFAAVIMMNCETDFVAKNEDFVAFTKTVLDAALAAKAQTLQEVLALEIEGGYLAWIYPRRRAYAARLVPRDFQRNDHAAFAAFRETACQDLRNGYP